MDVFLNGKMLPPADAAIGVNDAGFQHAVGLFETMAVYHGRAFRLDAHLQRLADSAMALGLVRELHTEPLQKAVEHTIAHNTIDCCRLRLTITAGQLSMLRRAADDSDAGAAPTKALPQPTVLIEPTEPTRFDPRYFVDGITALIAPPLANPFDPLAGHKTLNYWGRLRALRQAAGVGAGEAIVLNISNHLAGGAISNLFLVNNGELFTPFARGEEVEGALPAPVLPGITRAAVIELAERRGIKVTRRMLSVEDLLDADECFLTNSGWHILPVSRVEKKEISGGKAGTVTTTLRADLLELIEAETKGS